MRLTLIGHASVLMEHGTVCLWTDPWLEGEAFNDAWSIYPPARLSPGEVSAVTHIWISHEHPDHLSIPTLKSIPVERRKWIEVLYQRHWSPEVAQFLGGLGFLGVREMRHARWERLADDIEVCLHQVGHEDSSLAVRSRKCTILNLNDCKPSPAVLRRICAQIGPVDVLLNQFSIAGWPGNPSDRQRHAAASERTMRQLEAHVEVVDPRVVIPFASFVRFSHVENSFMNAAINQVGNIVERLGQQRAVVLYPGDSWEVSKPWDATPAALSRYQADYELLDAQPLREHVPKTFDEVMTAATKRLDELHASYHRLLLRRVPPVTFVVSDLGRALEFAPGAAEVREVDAAHGTCRVVVSSQAGWYTFNFRWGLTTLLISGRFRIEGDERHFRRLKQLGAVASGGMQSRGLVRSLVGDGRRRDLLRRRWRNLVDDFVRRSG